ncbi:hypothetical protein J7I42_23450 [Niastella sp. MAH-29]|uniref:Uncharacterized protein n=2 Tax=Chitinophagaceae TaxID=563835 RepID=A0ABS3YZB3_9BACT|nr:hypothetical protein [Niastella soli]
MKNGILDAFSGTIGRVVGTSWRGLAVMRSKAHSRRNANTPKQEEQKAKFKVASSFVQSMHDLLVLGFRDQAVRMTGANYALSLIIKEALDGANPDFKIAYDRVKISKGLLFNVEGLAVASTKPGAIQFTWTGSDSNTKEKPTDVAILVAHCPDLNRTVFKSIGSRDSLSGELAVPKFAGKVAHTWITFVSANGKFIANSEYIGTVNVS